MSILDSKGRLFGKVSLLDVGAALVILLVVGGLFLLPGSSGSSIVQTGATQPIEVDVIVRGLTVAEPQVMLKALADEKKTNIIIRNQPYGEVKILNVKSLPRTVAVPQPDGSVKPLPDPRPELNYTLDMVVTLGGDAQIVNDGPVLGNNKIKIGTPMELEGQTYRFNAPVIGVRILEKSKAS
ncbi:MAG: DUF4330 domain-containing protein [Drouetiella hepatica Uher 2000/2452]|jgi:hypothetical protein|uniref:DUF4330 domain-containing protein n=1 Tax=Drouetiella hepatica Uher 2000/2452 TaxID=904376 RepID=A0A951Q7T3_9CYAN|nr:DUF4330 domain-containing protein [Drouetiella hepatica Uher 2000/2452]